MEQEYSQKHQSLLLCVIHVRQSKVHFCSVTNFNKSHNTQNELFFIFPYLQWDLICDKDGMAETSQTVMVVGVMVCVMPQRLNNSTFLCVPIVILVIIGMRGKVYHLITMEICAALLRKTISKLSSQLMDFSWNVCVRYLNFLDKCRFLVLFVQYVNMTKTRKQFNFTSE